jgi:Flp pilus assembly protein TadG
MPAPDPRRRGTKRHGSLLTAELLFLLPLLLVILLALVEYTYLITGEARLAAASREGARVASLGGTASDVTQAVDRVLGTSLSPQVQLQVNFPNLSQNTGDPVQVVVSAPSSALAPNYLSVIGFDLSTQTMTAQTVMTIE